MKKIPLIIDCDPGHDDAIALIMMFSSPRYDIKAVTVSSGNQTLKKTTANVFKILNYINRSVPVALGAEKPMVRDLIIAPSVHGDSGLDGPVFTDLKGEPVSKKAWELSRDIILSSPDPVTLMATGPLTNLGILFTCFPEVKGNIERICIMGGGIEHGNWSIAAEFNILVDPEAAEIVFNAGIPLVMCGLDVTEKAMLFSDDIERLRGSGNVGKLVAVLLDFFFQFHFQMGFSGVPLHDPCAAAYLLDPTLFKSEDYHVIIETGGKYSAGATIADRRVNPGKASPNATVCMDIDRQRFVSLILECCRSYNE